MIDLSKAPDGATHYGVSDTNSICWYIVTDDKYKYIYDCYVGERDWSIGFHSRPVHEIKPVNAWTIYNNTKPLCELTDEQRGSLFNHWCNGGATQIFNGEEWCDALDGYSLINRNHAYRAKKKSERELFIDLATEIASDECETERIKESIDAFIIKLFKAGFKAPEGKRC